MASKALALPASLYSSDRLLEVAEELHHYATALAHPRRGTAAEPLSPATTDLLAILPAAKRDQSVQVEGLRQALEAFITTAPVVTLTLAALPSTVLKEELVAWLREEVRPNVLVNFQVNPDIAGGMVIRAGSHVYDCSFRTALLAEPARFTKELEHV